MDVSSSHHLGMLARAKQGTACGQVKLRKCVFCAMEPTNAAGVDVLDFGQGVVASGHVDGEAAVGK